jgi:uncharacterized protein (TIGR03083 family)
MTVIEALAREVGSVSKAIHRLEPAQWALPTRCPPLSVRELVAHMVRGGIRIQEMLDAGPVDAEPEKDAVTYFQYDATSEAPKIVKRAQESASEFPADLAKAWDVEWTKSLRRAREYIVEDPVLPNVFGRIKLSEYIRTRCVEVVVHHMDVDDALGKNPHPDKGALEEACDVLRGLLGTDLRLLGIDDVRFALIGTGRALLSDEEQEMLGSLSRKFPLLS